MMKLRFTLLIMIVTCLYSATIQAQSDTMQELMNTAKSHFKNKDYQATILALEKAIRANGETNAEIILWQAKSYVELGESAKAEKVMSSFYLYPVSQEQEDAMSKLMIKLVGGKPEQPSLEVTENNRKQDNEAMLVVDQQPQFNGGPRKMSEFISINLKYPEKAIAENIEGRVFVSFVVNKVGEVTRVELVKGIGGGCDEEAIRLVKSFPNFIPGRHKNEPVNVKVTLPIAFTLY